LGQSVGEGRLGRCGQEAGEEGPALVEFSNVGTDVGQVGRWDGREGGGGGWPGDTDADAAAVPFIVAVAVEMANIFE